MGSLQNVLLVSPVTKADYPHSLITSRNPTCPQEPALQIPIFVVWKNLLACEGFSPSGDEGKAIGFSARESWWYWALWQHVSNVNLHLPKALKTHNSTLGYLLGPPSSEQLDSEITAESWFSESRINRASLENCLKFSWMSNLYWLFPNQAFLNALIFQAGKGFCCLFLWVPGAQGSRFKITPHFDVL